MPDTLPGMRDRPAQVEVARGIGTDQRVVVAVAVAVVALQVAGALDVGVGRQEAPDERVLVLRWAFRSSMAW